MKKWMTGAGLILLGILVSFGISVFIVKGDFFMLNPDYTDTLWMSIISVPLVIYEIVYGGWYYRCAKQKSRSREVYKGEWFWMILAIAIDLMLLLAIFRTEGSLDETMIHIIISFVLSSAGFCSAFLFQKPF